MVPYRRLLWPTQIEAKYNNFHRIVAGIKNTYRLLYWRGFMKLGSFSRDFARLLIGTDGKRLFSEDILQDICLYFV